jgi:hypothetical protein
MSAAPRTFRIAIRSPYTSTALRTIRKRELMANFFASYSALVKQVKDPEKLDFVFHIPQHGSFSVARVQLIPGGDLISIEAFDDKDTQHTLGIK